MKPVNETQLEILSKNELMLSAIRAVFEERIEKEKPTIEPGINNNALGEKYRSYEKAKEILAGVFVDISNYSVDQPKTKGFNKAL